MQACWGKVKYFSIAKMFLKLTTSLSTESSSNVFFHLVSYVLNSKHTIQKKHEDIISAQLKKLSQMQHVSSTNMNKWYNPAAPLMPTLESLFLTCYPDCCYHRLVLPASNFTQMESHYEPLLHLSFFL